MNCAYDQEQLACLLRDFPQAQHYPQLTADLSLALHGVTDHTVTPTHLRLFLHALFATAEPQRTMNHLLRYLARIPQPHGVWEAWQQHPQALASTLTIFAFSSFLSSVLWRHPQFLLWLLDGALWASPPTPAALTEELASLLHDRKDHEAEVTACLRTFTQQHLLRIGARDLNNLADVEGTTADLSALADCVVQAGLDACQRWLQAVYGQPSYSDDAGVQHPCHFCVIGMGKLGGYELNFSSDIDLMYVYTSYQGRTSGVMRDGRLQHQISNHEYFVTLARRLTNVIGGKGPEGQAFRVDLRLRPDGMQGQLALSLLSYEAYYARLGQTWEKMALLKARPVAGNSHLGEEFMRLIQPFVYQRHLDAQGLQQLQTMKHQIDAQIADRAQSRTHVKLGLGGIREIEFFIQILQLLFGGRHPALQERHSLRALTRLRELGLIGAEVEHTLRHTYCYFRRLEHHLQMEQGAQTHTLPRHAAQQLRLARQLGFTTWEALYQDYLQRTEAVHAIFTTAFVATPT
jgi:[glutamine synthetase] adenylyltransferase / [glutamine synthetase]-adenylyl-L-tyrosine phosphorylase